MYYTHKYMVENGKYLLVYMDDNGKYKSIY